MKQLSAVFIVIAVLLSTISPAFALNVQNGKVIAGDLEYSYFGDGIFEVTDTVSGTSTLFTFAITGTYNGNPIVLASDDFVWNSPTINGDIVTLADTSSSWKIDFDFSNGDAKVTNTIKNNYALDLTNAKFYYVLSVEAGDTIITPAGMLEVQANTDKHYTNADFDLNSGVSEIKLRGITFNYQDIIADNFDITDVYVMDGDPLGYPNQKIVAVGFTKGSRVLGSGQTVVIDPTIEDGFSGYYNVLISSLTLTANTNETISAQATTPTSVTMTFTGTLPDSLAFEDV